MTKTESTIRFLFGASRKDIRPLVHAVDITIKLMFSQGIPMDDIRVTHAVYPQVAKRLKTRSGASPSAKTTARRIQRLAKAHSRQKEGIPMEKRNQAQLHAKPVHRDSCME